MIEIKGNYASAKVFTDSLEVEAYEQIEDILNSSLSEGELIRIMPDVHVGKSGPIGFTMTFRNGKVAPSIVGVDIGCGATAVRLVNPIEDLEAFDLKAQNTIPMGTNTYLDGNCKDKNKWLDSVLDVSALIGYGDAFFAQVKEVCKRTNQNYDRVIASLATGGGGNHFLELGKDSEGKHWFSVHSGSRNFGYRIADYWQEKAVANLNNRDAEIAEIKKNYQGKEIEERIKALPKYPKELAYLEGEDLQGYLRDAEVAQEYAELNRKLIILRLLEDKEVDLKVQSTHNYIEGGYIRKGAISAYEGQEVIIPLNMRDGSIFGIGKGNEDYNYSAPHGAGRKMSRSKAKEMITLDEFKESMEGIYSTCIVPSTVDESPMAYKDMNDIIENITDTVYIKEIIKPIWNFKAK